MHRGLQAGTLSETTPERKNIEWVTELDGGSATPIIAGDRIFLPTSSDDNKLSAVCLSRETGKIIWKEKMGTGRRAMRNAGMAAPSAVTDGKRVVFLFGNGTLAGMTVEGDVLWKQGRKTEQVTRFKMDDETWGRQVVCDASMIAVDDCIYVRTPTKLACVKTQRS